MLRQMSVMTLKRSVLPARRLMSCDQRVFRIAKGVSSVDYCSRHNVIVTGSVDRLVRVWNPFMTTSVTSVILVDAVHVLMRLCFQFRLYLCTPYCKVFYDNWKCNTTGNLLVSWRVTQLQSSL